MSTLQKSLLACLGSALIVGIFNVQLTSDSHLSPARPVCSRYSDLLLPLFMRNHAIGNVEVLGAEATRNQSHATTSAAAEAYLHRATAGPRVVVLEMKAQVAAVTNVAVSVVLSFAIHVLQHEKLIELLMLEIVRFL